MKGHVMVILYTFPLLLMKFWCQDTVQITEFLLQYMMREKKQLMMWLG